MASAMQHLHPPMVLLAAWQILYITALLHRHVRFGIGVTAYSLAWYGILALVGVSWTMAATILIVIEVATVVVISFHALGVRRISGLAFAAGGVLIILWSLLVPVSQHWRIIAAFAIIIIAPVFAVAFTVSGFGSFGVAAFQKRNRVLPRPGALYKYAYWSKRAVEDFLSNNGTGGRSNLSLARAGFSAIGAQIEFERTKEESGRHAAAQSLERLLAGYVDNDAVRILHKKEGFLQGTGDVYVTAYGTQGVDATPTGGRAMLFTHWTTADGQKVALCLFGSMDNFDGWIQDSHPARVDGWASSATSDVVKWLRDNAEWSDETWGESIGNVACKMANYRLAIGEDHAGTGRKNYEKVFVMRQEKAEWLAFIYHAEGRSDKLMAPFDIVLVGRPYWLRSRHLAIRTTDEYSEADVSGSNRVRWEQSYANFWKKVLRLDKDSKGWPLHLYQLLMAMQGIAPDI